MKVNYQELFPYEFKERLNANPLAFLPLGSLEYHGYHNVLGLDTLKAQKLCELSAQRAGGIVFPPLYLGYDAWPDIDPIKYPNKQYDCYHINKEVYVELLRQYFFRMKRIGFEKIFVLAGHYPNVDLAKETSQDIADIRFYIYKEPDLVEDQTGDHAGKWETSLLTYLIPEYVNLALMKDKSDRLFAVEGEDPNESSFEFGKSMTENIVSKIVTLVK